MHGQYFSFAPGQWSKVHRNSDSHSVHEQRLSRLHKCKLLIKTGMTWANPPRHLCGGHLQSVKHTVACRGHYSLSLSSATKPQHSTELFFFFPSEARRGSRWSHRSEQPLSCHMRTPVLHARRFSGWNMERLKNPVHSFHFPKSHLRRSTEFFL